VGKGKRVDKDKIMDKDKRNKIKANLKCLEIFFRTLICAQVGSNGNMLGQELELNLNQTETKLYN
jgi:hypothetical protein